MNIIPLHDHHAIESVSFGLEWTRPLAAEVMQALGGVHDGSLRQRLPARKPLRRIEWSLSPEGAHTLSTHDQTGWVFERFMPDGQPEISLLLAPEMIAVTNRAYTRWSAIAEEARALLAPFLPIIGASSDGFTTVGLQYVDVFMIDGPLAAFHPAMAFNSATTLLPPSVFTRRNLWHAHHGYFTEITAPVCARRLTVVHFSVCKYHRPAGPPDAAAGSQIGRSAATGSPPACAPPAFSGMKPMCTHLTSSIVQFQSP